MNKGETTLTKNSITSPVNILSVLSQIPFTEFLVIFILMNLTIDFRHTKDGDEFELSYRGDHRIADN